MRNNDERYIFAGFDSPRYTQVPDQLFDELLPRLSGAELKILLYIIRRTFGFKKDNDTISLKQMVKGICTKDGRVLDQGTGLSKAGVARAIRGLVEKDIIVTVRNQSHKKGDEPTTYALKDRNGRPVSHNETGGSHQMRHGGVSKRDTQETVEQQTDRHHSNLRKAGPHKTEMEDISSIIRHRSPHVNTRTDPPSDRDILTTYMRSIAPELGDDAPLYSTVTRLLRIYERTDVGSIQAFVNVLYQARALTREHSSSIRGGEPGARRRMPYFIAIVEDLVGLKDNNRRGREEVS